MSSSNTLTAPTGLAGLSALWWRVVLAVASLAMLVGRDVVLENVRNELTADPAILVFFASFVAATCMIQAKLGQSKDRTDELSASPWRRLQLLVGGASVLIWVIAAGALVRSAFDLYQNADLNFPAVTMIGAMTAIAAWEVAEMLRSWARHAARRTNRWPHPKPDDG